jgi:hypothetical protein
MLNEKEVRLVVLQEEKRLQPLYKVRSHFSPHPSFTCTLNYTMHSPITKKQSMKKDKTFIIKFCLFCHKFLSDRTLKLYHSLQTLNTAYRYYVIATFLLENVLLAK